MDKKKRALAQAYTAAVLAQLNAEVGASPFSVRTLAAELGMNYGVLLRYVNGERELPQVVLWAALDALEVRDDVFVKRARDRFESQPTG